MRIPRHNRWQVALFDAALLLVFIALVRDWIGMPGEAVRKVRAEAVSKRLDGRVVDGVTYIEFTTEMSEEGSGRRLILRNENPTSRPGPRVTELLDRITVGRSYDLEIIGRSPGCILSCRATDPRGVGLTAGPGSAATRPPNPPGLPPEGDGPSTTPSTSSAL